MDLRKWWRKALRYRGKDVEEVLDYGFSFLEKSSGSERDRERIRLVNDFYRDKKELYGKDKERYWRECGRYVEMKRLG